MVVTFGDLGHIYLGAQFEGLLSYTYHVFLSELKDKFCTQQCETRQKIWPSSVRAGIDPGTPCTMATITLHQYLICHLADLLLKISELKSFMRPWFHGCIKRPIVRLYAQDEYSPYCSHLYIYIYIYAYIYAYIYIYIQGRRLMRGRS